MKRTRGLACLIWLCSSTAFADDIVNIALVRPGPALIQNPCRAQTQYPLASLSTVLYVNRRLASSLPGGPEPIVMMEGSGLTVF